MTPRTIAILRKPPFRWMVLPPLMLFLIITLTILRVVDRALLRTIHERNALVLAHPLSMLVQDMTSAKAHEFVTWVDENQIALVDFGVGFEDYLPMLESFDALRTQWNGVIRSCQSIVSPRFLPPPIPAWNMAFAVANDDDMLFFKMRWA